MRGKNNFILLNVDLSIDLYTKELIPKDYYRNIARKLYNLKNPVYIKQIAFAYYQTKYNKSLRDVLYEFFEIPFCPISNEKLNIYHGAGGAKIMFNVFSENVTNSQIQNYNRDNNIDVIKCNNNMKLIRKGVGNPMFDKQASNKDIPMSDLVKEHMKLAWSNKTDEELIKIKNKQSISAKERLFHGHTGRKHSKENIDFFRQNTINLIKNKHFLHTETSIHIKIRELLKKLEVVFEEEYQVGYYLVDFRVGDLLIEVQGDYFHCNPKDEKNKIPKSKMQKKNVRRDKAKKTFIKNNTHYTLIEFWEIDINNNINKIEKCLKKLLKLKK